MAIAGVIVGTIRVLLLGSGLTTMLLGALIIAIAIVIGFVVESAVLLYAAKTFGGEGDPDAQAYLLAAAQAPMIIISSALEIIPALGFLAGLYSLWLSALALQAVHRYTLAKAVITALLPGIGLVLYVVVVMIV